MRGQTIYKAAAISTKIGRRNFKLTLSVLMFLFVYSLTGCCVVWGGRWGLGAINLKSYINIVGKLRSWWLVIREPCPLRRPPRKVPTKILLLLALCLLQVCHCLLLLQKRFIFEKCFIFYVGAWYFEPYGWYMISVTRFVWLLAPILLICLLDIILSNGRNIFEFSFQTW